MDVTRRERYHALPISLMPDAAPNIATPILAVAGVRKAFAGVVVLDDARFDVRAGEIHSLMGENGAGKSTLMKLLAGVHRPDAGDVLLDGRPATLASPHAAMSRGIALIHQEPLSFPELSVAENIFLSRGTPRGRLGQLDWATMRSRSRDLLSSLGLDLDPRTKLRGLSIADQQMVELAAALSQRARVLLMDEPTAALTPREADRLFDIARRLRGEGAAIVFISHRLDEVFAISDRITVLRDGRCIATHRTIETGRPQIIAEMVGRELAAAEERVAATPGATRLEAIDLTRAGRFADVSLTLRAGEIVGMAGLVGAGRTDVARALFGIAPADAGVVKIEGRNVSVTSPRQAIDLGIAYVPEDRQQHGLLTPMTVSANTTMADLGGASRAGWLSSKRERGIARDWAARLRTRLRDVGQPARELSGGNQQKVVLAKWLQTRPTILIVDEPTRGIDVGAKAEVHGLLAELARGGTAILMISSDLPEVLSMSDRILVMREGRVTGEFARGEATQERVMQAATGAVVASNRDLPAAQARRASSQMARLAAFREAGIAAIVALAFVACAIREPRFLSGDNLRSILLYLPIVAVVAMGQMMAIVSRNIDLSVGSILGLAAIVVGNLYVSHPAMPLPVALLAAMAVGGALGLLNGALVALLRVPSIIATLGTLTAYRGLIYLYSGGRQVERESMATLLNLGLAWIVVAAVVVMALTALWLHFTRAGRSVFAIGSNPHAAALRGIAVAPVLLTIFTVTGALSGLAGLMFAARFGYVNPVSTGASMELVVISAVVIGGTNVFGGSGSVVGVLLGCTLLALVNTALPMLGISAFWQQAFYGAAILVAASADVLLQRRAAGRSELA